MATTKADQAIAGANQLIGMMATLKTLRSQLTDFIKAYNSETYSTVWAAMATAAQNADGTLGTADGAANNAHPIDTRVAALANLQKAVTQTQLVAGVNALTQLQNFFGNVAVTTGNYTQAVDDLAS